MFVISWSVSPWQDFQGRGLPERNNFQSYGGLLALLTNIILLWKGIPGTNTGFLPIFVNYNRKMFNSIVTWSQCYKKIRP